MFYKKTFFIFLGLILVGGIYFKSVITYKSALYYCKTKNLSTTGEFLLCHYNFINKFDKNLSEKYLKIRDDCYKTFETQYEVSICTDEKMIKIK